MSKGKFLAWLKDAGIDAAKAIAETALGVIGANTMGICKVDWLGVASACALSGVMALLMSIKTLPKGK